MIARLLISSSAEVIKTELTRNLTSYFSNRNPNYFNHPDLLYFSQDSKLGIAEARKIIEHFSLKPYSAKGRVVILENASALTIEAQNALLKTLEELPENALFILAASSEAKLLPTILSRCQIIKLKGEQLRNKNYDKDIENLQKANLAEKFEYIEKLKEKEEFLKSLLSYFHQNKDFKFLTEILQAEEWAKQNVNIRAILEYLMLVLPSKL